MASDEINCNRKEISIPFCYSFDRGIHILCNFQEIFTNNSLKLRIDGKIFKNFKKIQFFGNFSKFFNINSTNLIYLRIENSFLLNFEYNVFPNLFHISLINCKGISNRIFSTNKLDLLRYLDLSKSSFKNLVFLQKISCKNLNILNISFTQIQYMNKSIFEFCPNIKYLNIMNLNIKNIHDEAFNPLKELEYFNFIYSNIQIFTKKHLIKNLTKLKIVKANLYYDCCIFWKIVNKKLECEPNYSEFQTCSKLIGSKLTSIFFWSFGIIGFSLNIYSIFYGKFRIKKSKFYQMMLTNSNLLTSIYILTIAVSDSVFGENFIENAHIWNFGLTCQLIGTIMTFSLLTSIFSTFLITIERYQAITKINKNFFKEYSKLIGISVLIILSMISFIPFIYENV